MENIVANPQGFQPRGKRGEGESGVGGGRGEREEKGRGREGVEGSRWEGGGEVSGWGARGGGLGLFGRQIYQFFFPIQSRKEPTPSHLGTN